MHWIRAYFKPTVLLSILYNICELIQFSQLMIQALYTHGNNHGGGGMPSTITHSLVVDSVQRFMPNCLRNLSSFNTSAFLLLRESDHYYFGSMFENRPCRGHNYLFIFWIKVSRFYMVPTIIEVVAINVQRNNSENNKSITPNENELAF